MTNEEMFCLGLVFGYLWGWLLHRKPPVIRDAKINANLVIDPKLLSQINAQMVTAWLEERNLTWMPKGAVFDPKRDIPQ